MRSGETVVPPQKNSRSEAMASGRAPAVSSICWRNGVAPPFTVQRSLSMTLMPSSTVHTSISTLAEPWIQVMSNAQSAPVIWVTGEGMKTTSSGPIFQASPMARAR